LKDVQSHLETHSVFVRLTLREASQPPSPSSILDHPFVSQPLSIHVVLASGGSAFVPFLHNGNPNSVKHRMAELLRSLWRKPHTPVMRITGSGMALA
jgi:hypothetical protein